MSNATWYRDDETCVAPEAKSLALVLKALLGSSRVVCGDQPPDGAAYRVVSYKSDFEFLWGVGRYEDSDGFFERLKNDSAQSSEINLVLVADGAPEESGNNENDVRVQEYVTPYDWVVALCCFLRKLPRLPAIRLFIFDMTRPADTSAFAPRTLPRFLPELPWIRVYRPAQMLQGKEQRVLELIRSAGGPVTFVGSRLSPVALETDALLADLLSLSVDRAKSRQETAAAPSASGPSTADMPTLDAVDRDAFATSAALLGQLWINQFTKPGGRHAVSNLVAPLLLASGLRQLDWAGAEDLHRKLATGLLRMALRTFLEALGVFRREVTPKGNGSREHSTTRPNDLPGPGSYLIKDAKFFPTGNDDIFGRFKGVRFLLVDDQCRLGYEDILACLLFGKPKARNATDADPKDTRDISLVASDSPEPLVKALYDAATPTVSDAPPSGSREDDYLKRLLHFFDRSGACNTFRERDPNVVLAAKAARQRVEILSRGHSHSPGSTPTFSEAQSNGGADICKHCGGRLDTHNEQATIDWDMPRVLGQPPKQAAGQDGVGFDIVLYDLRLFHSSGQTDLEGSPAFVHHLLLPLLLSYLDPSLPIILFSSTQQRFVAEALRSRPSIVTLFSKPMMSGYADLASPEKAIEDLIAAMRNALRLHKVRAVWQELETLSQSLTLNVSEPLVEFVRRRSRDYRVDRLHLDQLCKEYTRLLCSGFYADALAVPGNVLDFADARVGRASAIDNLMSLVIKRSRSARTAWHAVVDLLLQQAHLRKFVIELVSNALRAFAGQHPRSSRDVLAMETYFRGRPEAGWVATFASERPIQATRLARSGLGHPDQALDRALEGFITQKSLLWREDVKQLAARQFYAVIQGLRNVRHHYVCRPWAHDELLEDYAIWVWLWLCKGLREKKVGSGPLQISAGATEDVAVLAVRSNWLARSNFDEGLDAIDACNEFFFSLGHLVDCGLLTSTPLVDRLVRFARGLATAANQGQRAVTQSPPVPGPPVAPTAISAAASASTAPVIPASPSLGLAASTVVQQGRQDLFVLVGCPVPPKVNRQQINRDVRAAGFARDPKRVYDTFQLQVDPSEGDILENARAKGILVCGHRVTLRPVTSS